MFYNEGPEAKKQKKKFSQADIDAKVKLAVEKKAAEDGKKTAEDKYELLQQAVNAAVTACRNDFATNLVPVIINWTKENPDKTVHDFPLPSFVGSNSMKNNTIAPSLAHATRPPLAVAPAHSSPSSVSGALGGPSSLVELDAVTVITCRINIYIIFHFCCLSVVLRHRHMCLQAKETPCTILYLIKVLGKVAEIQNFPTSHQDLSMDKLATRERGVHLHTLVDR